MHRVLDILSGLRDEVVSACAIALGVLLLTAGTLAVHHRDAAAQDASVLDAGAAPSISELIADIAAAQRAAEDAKKTGDKQPLYLAYAALGAVVLRFGVEGLKDLEVMQPTPTWIPIAVTALGGCIAVLGKYVGGMSWMNALVVAGIGPGSIVVHEVWSGLKPLLGKIAQKFFPKKAA